MIQEKRHVFSYVDIYIVFSGHTRPTTSFRRACLTVGRCNSHINLLKRPIFAYPHFIGGFRIAMGQSYLFSPNASQMELSKSSEKDIPAASACWGKILLVVSPGVVFTSNKYGSSPIKINSLLLYPFILRIS